MFRLWLESLFLYPFKNYEMLWILVPIWVTWFFAEFFQEKTGTSFGNAITNAVVVLWGSIDWSRQTIRLMSDGIVKNIWSIIGIFSLIALIFSYGLLIMILGIKGNPITKKIGRIRAVTYVFAMFTPVVYNVAPLSLKHFFAAILFFPIFYFVIEFIDRKLPDPKAVKEDNSKSDNFSPMLNQPASQTQGLNSQFGQGSNQGMQNNNFSMPMQNFGNNYGKPPGF
ncbi:MAG: hypothetical protein V1859_11285 [archaeon]